MRNARKLMPLAALSTCAVAVAAALSLAAAPAAAQEVTVVSFGGAYQDGQSKAVFQPAGKALGMKVKEETYTGIGDLRLKMKAGANGGGTHGIGLHQ